VAAFEEQPDFRVTAMTATNVDQKPEYDVALSFAGEDRALARELAALLRDAGFKVFYDEYEQATLWGKNLYDHLTDVYSKRPHNA